MNSQCRLVLVQTLRNTKHVILGLAAGVSLAACSLLATRPTQEMSNTAAALKAAKEVSADTIAPELYRQAGEWYFRAKNEFRYKNFKEAREYANKARAYAEQAEFEAIRNGAQRTETTVDPITNEPKIAPPPEPVPAATPTEQPTPVGTPYEEYEAAQKKNEPTAPTPTPTPT
jgi:hypothetical protein